MDTYYVNPEKNSSYGLDAWIMAKDNVKLDIYGPNDR